MRHLFIINPRAGKKDSTSRLMEQIESLRRNHGLDCDVILTAHPGHGEESARRAAENGEALRIYACGGDGTLNEVANGIVGFPNVEMTVVPVGTGNDFMKNFGEDASRFTDLEQLWDAPTQDLDLINCNDRYALTVACMGLDARVADDVHKYSGYPGISGGNAYIASLGINFFKSISQRMTITCDGQTTIGEYAIVCVCNGRYYGGGFIPVADARMDDGILDSLIVKKISRATMLRILPDYKKGNAWKFPHIARRVSSKNIRIQTKEPIAVCLDGEVTHSKDISISISDQKLHFFAPAGASCNRTAREPREK